MFLKFIHTVDKIYNTVGLSGSELFFLSVSSVHRLYRLRTLEFGNNKLFKILKSVRIQL